MTFAMTMPATSAAPTTSHGFGPPAPLPRFGFGRLPSCGADGETAPCPRLRSVGASPVARALMGKTVGDTVEVSTPGGGKSYEVIKVMFR